MTDTREITNLGAALIGIDNLPQNGVPVRFQLVGLDGKPCDAWGVNPPHERVAGIKIVKTINGIFPPVSLVPNDRLNKNTRYLCSVGAPGVADFIAYLPSDDLSPITWAQFAANGTALVPAEMQQVYVQHSLATAANDVLVGGGIGGWVKKTLAEFKTILGLGTAAYTDSSAYDVAGAAVHANSTALDMVTGVNTGDQTLASLGAEAAANKATSFAVVNDILYPSVQSVKTYVDGLVVGLLRDCGIYDASGNTFPAAGGSGPGGAILKGDLWYICASGTLGGVSVNIGDSVRALVEAPAQLTANWSVLESNIGYVPENITNKDTDGSLAANSDTKYPSQKAVKTYADTKLGLYWTEALYNTGVNATNHAVRMQANSSTLNVDAILSPKGSGAILAQVPDGTATGGNKRGANSFDMQRVRTAASMVASGANSVQFGENNTTSGSHSLQVGYQNTSSGNYSAVLGYNNASSASITFIAGGSNTIGSGGAYASALGYYNTIGGNYAFAVGRMNVSNGEASSAIGYGCSAYGQGSAAIGMSCVSVGMASIALGYAANANVIGKIAYGAGTWTGTTGEAQGGLLAMRCATTTNVAAVLTSNGQAVGLTNQFVIPIHQAAIFEGRIIGKRQNSANMVTYRVEGRIVNNGGAVTVDGVTLTAIGADTIGLDAVPTFLADNTNKALTVTSGYKTSTNIRWVCNLWSTEVIYAP